MAKEEKRDSWSNNFGFVMAAAGAAVGLGNIWRFPYTCGENGGGAFILVYLFCVFFIGMPVLISELAIGRASGQGGAQAFSALVKKNKKLWYSVGFLGIFVGFLITSYYTIIAGWTLEYLWDALSGMFTGMNASSPEYFKEFMASDSRQIFWHIVFTVITVAILMGGVSGGIEKVAEILMPILLFILVGLAIYGLSLESDMAAKAGEATKALKFLFQPDWSKFTDKSIFEALGQAAFSLSIAVGTMVAYGSYLDKKENLTFLGPIVVCMDTAVGLLGGVVVFPIVFAFGLNPSAGTGLIFETLPNLFSQVPGGNILAPSFYLLLFFAALTSSVSLLEPAITYLVDQFKLNRQYAAVTTGAISTVLGIVWIFTNSLENSGLLTNVDKLVSTILVPLVAVLISIFMGWFVEERIVKLELTQLPSFLFKVYIFLLRWVCPIVITIILVKGVIQDPQLF
jgi:neurotransmitter:Na+ symporter, NSS family